MNLTELPRQLRRQRMAPRILSRREAEIYLLKLEAAVRAANEAATTASTSLSGLAADAKSARMTPTRTVRS